MKAPNHAIITTRVLGILFLAAGYGWAGGHFIPTDSGALPYLFQGFILITLLILSLGFLKHTKENALKPSKNWATNGLHIFTTLSLVINLFNIIRGAFSRTSSSLGSHNSLADLVPVGILIAGNLMWIVSGALARNVDKKLAQQ